MEERIKDRIWYVIPVIIIVALLVFGINRELEAKDLRQEIKMDYQRCFTEVVQYLDDIQPGLEKMKFVNDPMQMLHLSGEIYRQASQASANLAMLPLGSEPLEHLCEFLNQVGNFAYSLSYKMIDGEKITDEDYENLRSLEGYARSIAAMLDSSLEEVYNGSLTIERVASKGEMRGIDSAMGDVEKQLHDYPALIYDGPFSSHLDDKKAELIKNEAVVSEEEARKIVYAVSGKKDFKCVAEEGKLPAYYFYDSEGLCTASVTKMGGRLLSYLNDREINGGGASIGDAKIAAARFLEMIGFEDMKESYYEITGDVAVINYAAVQEGYVLYPDLVKIKVALDDCSVTGFEGRGYIMNHKKREIPEIKISREEAATKINEHVNILSAALSVIPKEGSEEAFCWQFEGELDDRKCLIYINTQTGSEEELFLLIESESGVLAV